MNYSLYFKILTKGLIMLQVEIIDIHCYQTTENEVRADIHYIRTILWLFKSIQISTYVRKDGVWFSVLTDKAAGSNVAGVLDAQAVDVGQTHAEEESMKRAIRITA